MNDGYQIAQSKPNYVLTFHKDGKEVGSFDFNEGRMHFKGDVSESGKIFVDWIISGFQQRIDDAVKAEREECAKLCEDNATDFSEGDWDSACINCSDLIKARGN